MNWSDARSKVVSPTFPLLSVDSSVVEILEKVYNVGGNEQLDFGGRN
jgi:hypothetical protein